MRGNNSFSAVGLYTWPDPNVPEVAAAGENSEWISGSNIPLEIKTSRRNLFKDEFDDAEEIDEITEL